MNGAAAVVAVVEVKGAGMDGECEGAKSDRVGVARGGSDSAGRGDRPAEDAPDGVAQRESGPGLGVIRDGIPAEVGDEPTEPIERRHLLSVAFECETDEAGPGE